MDTPTVAAAERVARLYAAHQTCFKFFSPPLMCGLVSPLDLGRSCRRALQGARAASARATASAPAGKCSWPDASWTARQTASATSVSRVDALTEAKPANTSRANGA